MSSAVLMGDHNDKEHFVAWLDLLGFRDLIEEKSTVQVANLLETHIPRALRTVVPKASFIDGAFVFGDNRCEVEQFQDTLVLWTLGTKVADLEALLEVTAGMVAILHINGLPARGGISKGTVYTSRLNPDADKNVPVVIGQGVKRASDMEKGRSWAGVSIHPDVTNDRDVHLDLIEWGRRSGKIVSYSKHRTDGEDLCLGWPSLLPRRSTDDIIERMWPKTPSNARGREIRENTRNFVAWWKASYGLDIDLIEKAAREFADRN